MHWINGDGKTYTTCEQTIHWILEQNFFKKMIKIAEYPRLSNFSFAMTKQGNCNKVWVTYK